MATKTKNHFSGVYSRAWGCGILASQIFLICFLTDMMSANRNDLLALQR